MEPTSRLTVADSPRAKEVLPGPHVGQAAARTIATTAQTMQVLEARRAWSYAFGLGMLSVVAFFVVWGIGGDPLAQHIHMAGLACTAVAMGAYAALRRDPARYRPIELLAITSIAMLANATGFFYWGVYSGFLSVIAASGYAMASTANRRHTIIATSMAAALHVGLGGAQLAGWIAEHSLVVIAPWTPRVAIIVSLVLMQAMVVVAVVGGIDAKAQLQRVLDGQDAALRKLAQREAQLAEVELEIREAHGPHEGRHTGRQLGQFRLGDVIGRGAMGEVYAADDADGRPCAVKVLAPHLLDDRPALERFHREARAIASIDAPNIVRMIEVSPPNAPQPYLAMERLEGRDLGAFLKEQPSRSLDELVAIVRDLAAGLEAAHAAGVIHRDLKPANVFGAMIAGEVRWKILDFGVSKLFGEATATIGHVVGTPGYMAPEQARGLEVDRRADVYSLGVIAYRVLTGRPAVVPGDLPVMIHEVVYRMPPAPSDFVRVSVGVEAVLALALAKSPDERFATAGELADELARAARDAASPGVIARADALLRRVAWGQWLVQRRPASSM